MMTQDEALVIARAVWGSSAFAAEHRAFDTYRVENGWQIPTGRIIGYSVGYRRKGKKHTLSTIKGSTWDSRSLSFEVAFNDALKKTYGTKAHDRLEIELDRWYSSP